MDEYTSSSGFINNVNKRLRKALTPYMPPYISSTIKDMGVYGLNLSGYSLSIPRFGGNKILMQKKLLKAAKKSRSMGAEVIVVDGSILKASGEQIVKLRSKFKISDGIFYRPSVLIEACMKVSALMGINFWRCGICIADASTEIGLIMTELLMQHANFLTLCTEDKDRLNDIALKYIKSCGISAPVVSDYKKAMDSCDILIYTGNADINKLVSFASHKMLIMNLSDEEANINKPFLMIDDAALAGQREPVILTDRIADDKYILTSRIWEGALLANLKLDGSEFSISKANEFLDYSRKLNIKIKAVMKLGRPIDRDMIYSYR
jgi:hypothetical protein